MKGHVDLFSDEFIGRDCTEKELQEIREHLATCPECKERYKAFMKLPKRYDPATANHYSGEELKEGAKQDWAIHNERIDGEKLPLEVRKARRIRYVHLSQCQECSILYWEMMEEIEKEEK